MFVHFQPPGYTGIAQEVSQSQQPWVEGPLDTESGEGLGCMREGARFISKMGFLIRHWCSKDFLAAFC